MTVSPEERFHQRKRRHSKEELARRGKELYDDQIRQKVEADNFGKIVAIDIETGDFEVSDNTLAASDRLLERCPNAQTWFIRIGHRGVHRFGCCTDMNSVLKLLTVGPSLSKHCPT
jgi:hypothetical protein